MTRPSPATRYPLPVLILAALACLYAGVLIEWATRPDPRPPLPVTRPKLKPGHPPPRVTDRRQVI